MQLRPWLQPSTCKPSVVPGSHAYLPELYPKAYNSHHIEIPTLQDRASDARDGTPQRQQAARLGLRSP